MNLRRLFGEYVPEGKQSTPNSAKHNRRANISAIVLVLGMITGVVGAGIEFSHQDTKQQTEQNLGDDIKWAGIDAIIIGGVELFFQEQAMRRDQVRAQSARELFDQDEKTERF